MITPQTDECGASPATTTYAITGGLRLVTTRSRTGLESRQWFDAAGQLVREQNAYGGKTEYEYDPAGNLRHTWVKAAAAETDFVERHTEFKYDALNRQRETIQHGTPPITTYTDYFLPSDFPAGAPVAWDMVTTDAAGRSTATLADSLGQPILVIGPPGITSANSAYQSQVMVTGYQYAPAQMQTTVTTTQSVGTPATARSPCLRRRRTMPKSRPRCRLWMPRDMC